MDVISWVVGLVAGTLVPLPRALALAAGTSVLIRVYQYFLPEPPVWGTDMPEDLIGATAMILASCLFAYVGSIVRSRRLRHSAG